MDDSKPANESNESGLNKIDLSQLQDFTFGTQWTEVKAPAPGGRRDRDFDRGGERRERRDDGGHRGGPGGGPRDRRGFRKPAGAPVGEGQAAGQRPPMGGERPPRGEGFRGGPRNDFRGGPGGGERRDFRGGERGAPMERGPYVSPYFTCTCYPEDVGFAAMVKAVRASCRTFQLFEITKAVLEKNDRFVIVIQRKPAERSAAPAEGEASAGSSKPGPLFMSMPDHLPFDTEEAAIQHVLSNHLGNFFTTEEVEIEAPRGNFPIINKCGVTGELLGPPNYHKYQQILAQHHASRLGRMPFEKFRESIVSAREPEIIQQWLDKMKKTTRYTWKPQPAKHASAPVAAAPAVETPAVEATAVEATAAEATAPDAPAAESAAESAPASAPEAAPAGPSFDSFEEARAYLLANAKEKVVRAFENIRFHGKVIEKLPPGEIKRAIEGHVERQRRFPLDTANALRGRLRREGFTIFKKGSRGVSYVCAVKRRFRVPGQVFSETITALIDFVEKNPMVHVKDLPLKFLGIDLAAAMAAVPAAAPEGTPASQAPFVALPPEQAERLRKMNNDLRWLVMEGYVTEFSDGKLFAAPPMAPQAAKKAESGEEHDPVDFPEAPAPEAAPEAAPEDTSAEAAAHEESATEAQAAAGETAPADAAPTAAAPAETPAEPSPAAETPAEQEKPAGQS